MVEFKYPQIFIALILELIIGMYMIRVTYSTFKSNLSKIHTTRYLDAIYKSNAYFIKQMLFIIFSVMIAWGASDPSLVLFSENGGNTTQRRVFVLLDVSKSMYVNDGSSTRIEHAVSYLKNIINEHQMGLYSIFIFTDKLVQLVPWTDETGYLNESLETIVHKPLIDGSTDYNQSFGQLIDFILKHNIQDDELNNSVLLFFTDGETQVPFKISVLKDLSSNIGEYGFYSVGRKNDPHRVRVGDEFLLDEQGNPAISVANPDFVRSLALAINAKYEAISSTSQPDVQEFNKRKSKKDLAWLGWFGASLTLLGYIVIWL